MSQNRLELDELVDGIAIRRLGRRDVLRRAIGFGLGAPMVAGLLAACGDDDDDDDDADADETSESGAGTEEPAEDTQAPEDDATPTTGEDAAGEPQQGGTLTIGVDQEPPTMDPHASPSAITFTISSSACEGLLYLTAEREILPWLAESWEISEDGTSYTFVLRQDVTFQDGTPFNAEAVKWNFDRIVDPDFTAGASLGNMAGYQGTEVVDEFTAVVTFEEAFAPFLTYAAGPFLPMISPTATEEQGDAVNQTPVTTGPYIISEYVARDHVTLTRWADYNRQAPWSDHEGPGYLDEVIWKFIPEAGTRVTTVESGETQMITVIPAQDLARLEENDDFTVAKFPWGGVPRSLLLNTHLAPTDDINVRQAINHAINKDVLVDTLIQGSGFKATGVLTKSMLEDPSLLEDQYQYPFDLDRAKQLLDEAGWAGDDGDIRSKDGQPLEFEFNTIDYGAGPDESSQFVQGQLREVGIDVKIKAQARPPFYEDNYNCATAMTSIFLRSGEWDALYALFHSSNIGGNFNWSCLDDPEIDEMLEQGRAELDEERRRQLYVDLQKKLLELAVAVPLHDDYSVWVMQSQVTGLIFSGYTYPIVADMWLTE
jgi:peptide/nickel transport system substrate-binding protein